MWKYMEHYWSIQEKVCGTATLRAAAAGSAVRDENAARSVQQLSQRRDV